jgi:1-deoxyxylulose-5-phosphate synthase
VQPGPELPAASSPARGCHDAALPRLEVRECIGYALTLEPAVALLGLSFENEQDAAFAAAAEFTPLSARELEAARGKGRVWWDPTGALSELR